MKRRLLTRCGLIGSPRTDLSVHSAFRTNGRRAREIRVSAAFNFQVTPSVCMRLRDQSDRGSVRELVLDWSKNKICWSPTHVGRKIIGQKEITLPYLVPISQVKKLDKFGA